MLCNSNVLFCNLHYCTCILFKKHSFANCKLTSLTSFFCCNHHNDKWRLRFNTADTNIPARHFLAPRVRAVGACPYLLLFNNIIFSWVLVAITCFKLKILQQVKGANLLCPLDVRGLKCFQLQGASPLGPLTRGSAPDPIIGSRSALACGPLNWSSGSASAHWVVPNYTVWCTYCNRSNTVTAMFSNSLSVPH